MQCDRLECAPFAALAARLHELSPKLSWRAAASHVASTLASFPDGVTQPVLLCTAPSKGGTSKNGSAVEQLRERLHVCPKDVIELTVCGVKKTDRILELTDGVSGLGPQLRLLLQRCTYGSGSALADRSLRR